MEYHGLAPIAVDLNINDLSMRMDLLKQAITKVRHTQSIAHSQHCWLRLLHRASLSLSCHCSHGLGHRAFAQDTKVLIISHLFGTRSDFADVIELAHEHGIIVVEVTATTVMQLMQHTKPLCVKKCV